MGFPRSPKADGGGGGTMIHTVHSSMASFFQPRRLLHLQHPRVRGPLREQPSGKAFWGGFGLEEGEFARREWPARGGGGGHELAGSSRPRDFF